MRLIRKLSSICSEQTAILRTKDYLKSPVPKPEIEDLLRETLITVARDQLGWDVMDLASRQSGRPIVDIFAATYGDFSKYRLAKAFVRWSRDHTAADLTEAERHQWIALITAVNNALA